MNAPFNLYTKFKGDGWIRQQTSAQFIPILGARTLDQLQYNLDSLKFTLDQEHFKRLNEVGQIERGFPADILDTPMRTIIFGKTYELINNPYRIRG